MVQNHRIWQSGGAASVAAKGAGETFTAYTKGGGGVLAELGKDGFLDLAIQKGPGTPSGGQMFNEALAVFGNNVKGIRGTWLGTGSMKSNFDSFQAAIRAGATPEQAALGTFTGKMSARNGFANARIVVNSPKKVVVEFGK